MARLPCAAEEGPARAFSEPVTKHRHPKSDSPVETGIGAHRSIRVANRSGGLPSRAPCLPRSSPPVAFPAAWRIPSETEAIPPSSFEKASPCRSPNEKVLILPISQSRVMIAKTDFGQSLPERVDCDAAKHPRTEMLRRKIGDGKSAGNESGTPAMSGKEWRSNVATGNAHHVLDSSEALPRGHSR